MLKLYTISEVSEKMKVKKAQLQVKTKRVAVPYILPSNYLNGLILTMPPYSRWYGLVTVIAAGRTICIFVSTV